LKVPEGDSLSSSGLEFVWVRFLQFLAFSGNVGPEEGDELEESGPVASSSRGPWFALLLHALACTQASTCPALLLVVRYFLLHHFCILIYIYIFIGIALIVCLLRKWKKRQEILGSWDNYWKFKIHFSSQYDASVFFFLHCLWETKGCYFVNL
jgi:hypothetical protein